MCKDCPEPTNDNPAAAAPVITPTDERRKWDKVKALKLERKHHDIGYAQSGMQEVKDICEALRIEDHTFQKATGARMAKISQVGTFDIFLIESGIRVNGKRVGNVELVAVAPGKYDVRVIAFAYSDGGETIPDDVWSGGAEILAIERDVPTAWLFKTVEKLLGVDLTQPMPRERRVRAIIDRAGDNFENCDCPECVRAQKAALANKTEIVDERRKIADAAGDKDFDDLFRMVDGVRKIAEVMTLAQFNAKLDEALNRSILVTDEPTTVN